MNIFSFPDGRRFQDRDRNGGGIMLYFREDIPSILLATEEKSYSEGFYVELNWRNNKWLIN